MTYRIFQEVLKWPIFDKTSELLDLALGVILPGGMHYRNPGTYYMARWMAKAIITLQIYLFQTKFNLSTSKKKKIIYPNNVLYYRTLCYRLHICARSNISFINKHKLYVRIILIQKKSILSFLKYRMKDMLFIYVI